jgi:hypothetical protein
MRLRRPWLGLALEKKEEVEGAGEVEAAGEMEGWRCR